MRPLMLLAALLILPATAAAAPPPVPERAVMLRVTLPLSGGPDRPAWRPHRPSPNAPERFSGSDVATNLSEGWWGIGILAVGGAVWLYQENRN
jgi:hypothetical protein